MLTEGYESVEDNSKPIILDVEHSSFQGDYVADLGHVFDSWWRFYTVFLTREEDVYGEEGCDGFIEKRLSEVIKYETTYVGLDCSNVTSEEDVRR